MSPSDLVADLLDSAAQSRFDAGVARYGLQRYARELLEIETGGLPEFPPYREFRRLWRGRAHPWESAALFGGTGTGKSTVAMWACREACRAGGIFAWFDMMEMPAILAADDSAEQLSRISRADLLVIDEVGDSADLRGRSWAEIKSRINIRFRADKPTILGSISAPAALSEIIGPEVLRRFPIQVGA